MRNPQHNLPDHLQKMQVINMWDRANGRSEIECTNISVTSKITSTNRRVYTSTCRGTTLPMHVSRLSIFSLETRMIQSRLASAISASIIGSCNLGQSNHTGSMSCQHSDWRFHLLDRIHKVLPSITVLTVRSNAINDESLSVIIST